MFVVDDRASAHAGLPLFKCKTDVGLTPSWSRISSMILKAPLTQE
jgi:hypothetical protein